VSYGQRPTSEREGADKNTQAASAGNQQETDHPRTSPGGLVDHAMTYIGREAAAPSQGPPGGAPDQPLFEFQNFFATGTKLYVYYGHGYWHGIPGEFGGTGEMVHFSSSDLELDVDGSKWIPFKGTKHRNYHFKFALHQGSSVDFSGERRDVTPIEKDQRELELVGPHDESHDTFVDPKSGKPIQVRWDEAKRQLRLEYNDIIIVLSDRKP
jgi:hypothetical protein